MTRIHNAPSEELLKDTYNNAIRSCLQTIGDYQQSHGKDLSSEAHLVIDQIAKRILWSIVK